MCGKIKLPVLILVIFLSQIVAYSQSKLSPKFDQSELRLGANKYGKFTLSVCDISRFISEYCDIEILEEYPASKCLSVVTDYKHIFQIANSENVVFIDFHEPPKEESFLDKPDFELNRIRKAQYSYPTLKGENVTVSVKERSIEVNDLDVKNRVVDIGLALSETSQHATAMATIIGGAGNSDEQNLGVAPKTILVPSGFDDLFPDDDLLLDSHHIYLQNHSYGVDIENYYGNEAYAYDLSMSQNPKRIHVFSSGNYGESTPESGVYSGMPVANLTGTFKQSKNALVVNAFDTLFYVNEKNSIGPAYDGRLKPELSAYGANGTSDAAALTTGVIALMQEHFSELYDSLPTSDLVKAILVAGSDDIGPEGIDFKTGYGSVNSRHNLSIIDQEQFSRFLLKENGDSALTIEVPAGIRELRLALVWNDLPAKVNANQALVNDVDVKINSGEVVYYPWVLNTYPHEDSLFAPAVRKEDHLNNVEFFTIENPKPGNVKVVVSGKLLNTDQQVSLAYWMIPADYFEWDYPLPFSKVESGKNMQLVYENTFDLPAKLSYRLNHQGDWQTIENQPEPSAFTFWQTPDTSAWVELKMEIGDQSFSSGSFLLSPKPTLEVTYNCEDKLGFIWASVDDATGYELYEMGDQYLTLVSTTLDTSFAVSKDKFQVYYAVRPLYAQGEGLRSSTINVDYQGAFCYINLFEMSRVEDNTAKVKLSLSTLQGISQIEILKIYRKDTVVWQTIEPVSETDFELFEEQLYPGLTEFQAVLYFENGEMLKSEISGIYIEKENRMVVFPNPVINDKYVNLLSEGDGVIRIFNAKGKFLEEKEVLGTVDDLYIGDLASGLYFYRFLRAGQEVDAGKFIVLK